MKNFKPFPETPEVTQEDRLRLKSAGYLNCWNAMNSALSSKPPSAEDLKKLILIELERKRPRSPMINKFIIRLQKAERVIIMGKIIESNPKKQMIPVNLSYA